MATSRRDVSLVIRAKDEATKAFEAAAGALESLLRANNKVGASATNTGSKLEELAAIALNIDKAYAKISGSADSAAAAFQRQQSALAESKTQLAALKGQADAAAIAMTRLSSADAIVGAGRDQSGRIKQLAYMTEQYGLLGVQQAKLTASIAAQESVLDGQRSSLQQIGSTAIAAADAQAQLVAEIHLQTEASKQAAVAAEHLSDIQKRINAATGVAGTGAGKASASADLLAQADAHYVLIQSLKAEQVAQVALTATKDAERRAATLLPGNAVTGKSAKDSAAAFLEADAAAAKILEIELRKTTLAEAEMESAAARLRAQLDPLAEIQRRLAKEIADTEALFNAGKISALEMAAAVTKLKDASLKASEQLAPAADNMIRKLKAEQEAYTQLMQQQEAQLRAATLLPGNAVTGKSAKESAAAFMDADAAAAKNLETEVRNAAQAEAEMEAATARLRTQLDPMAAIQARLNKEIAEVVRLRKADKISALEEARAIDLLRASADKAAKSLGKSGVGSEKPSLFGLTPYGIQNLSYQINDVFTQLASGTSLSQTLAQQGGQLIQIFPRVGSAIGAAFSSAPVIALIASVGGLILALREVERQAALQRIFEGSLLATADATVYQGAALAKTADALDRYGLSAAEATAVVKIFTRDGVNPARLIEFGLAAKNMADVLGIDVKDAAKQLTGAFDGSYLSIKKLDDSMNFLTLAERERIQSLYDAGKAEEARSEAFRIFSERMDAGASKMRGPWSDAARSLGGAWDAVLKALAKSEMVIELAHAIDYLAQRTASFFNAMSGTVTVNGLTNDIQNLQDKIDDLERTMGLGDLFGLKRQQILEYRGEIEKLQAALAKLKQDGQAGSGDTIAQETQAQAKASADLAKATDTLAAKNKTLSDSQRILGAESKARAAANLDLENEAYKAASDATKQEYVRQKVAEARREIEKQITDERETQRRQDEAAIKSFSSKVIGVESSGNTNAKNDKSTATGVGQFIEQTWLDLFRKYYPEQVQTMGEQAILALRKDSEVSAKLIDLYARENAERLKKAGQSVTEANLYLLHFLGARGGMKLLQAPANAPVSGFLGGDQIAANKSVLQGKTAGQVRTWAGGKFDSSEASKSRTDVATRLAAIEQDRLDTQDKFDAKLTDEQEKRSLGIESLIEQRGLQGEALIAKQREQEVATAVLAKQQEIDKINADRVAAGLPEIKLTQEQLRGVELLAGAYFDLAHAKDVAAARRDAVQNQVNELTAQRTNIENQIGLLQQQGDTSGVTALQTQLADVNLKLADAQTNMIAFWQSVLAGANGGPAAFNTTAGAIQNTIDKIKESQLEMGGLGTATLMTGKQINQTMAQGLAGAFDQFAQSVADGANVMTSLRDAFLQFAADFLRQIAQMILKQAILNALGGATGDGSGGVGGIIASAVAGIFHEGGIAGGSSPTRSVSPALFTNAMRYHQGGIAGLKPNEVPAILQRGEEILTRSDARHAANGGGAGSGGTNIKNVVVFNPADVLSQGLSTKVGEQVLLTFVRENRGAFQAALA